MLTYSVRGEPNPRDLLTIACAHYGFSMSLRFSLGKGKGKVHPRTGHEGPDREKTYSSTLSLPSALDGGWVVNATPRPLYPQERLGTRGIRDEVSPCVSLDGYGKSRPHRDSIPGQSSA